MPNFFSDLDNSESNQEKRKFFQDIDEPSRVRSIASAPLKGLIRGARKFSPLPSLGPIKEPMAERLIEQFLPTQKDRTLEDVLEFTAENAPLVALGEGGLIKKGVQSLVGGLFKKGAKEAELPEWAQDVSGGIGTAAPQGLRSVISKPIRSDMKQKAVVDMLRDRGFSENEIVPFIQNKKKMSFLSKPALKFERESPFVKGIKEKLNGMYDNLRARGQDGNYLEGEALKNFEKSFFEKLDKIPPDFKELIKKNEEQLFQNPIDFTSLHDFVMGVNRKIKGIEGGKSVLGILKEPVRKAQEKLNPSLYKDLRDTDSVYKSFKNYLNKMTKEDYQTLVKWGPELGSTAIGVLTLNPALFKLAGAVGLGRLTASQFLRNPRLQNMHLKLIDSIKKNDSGQALKIINLMGQEADKIERESD